MLTRPAFNDLVAIAIKANALQAMDPEALVGSDGQTAQARLDSLQQRREPGLARIRTRGQPGTVMVRRP